MRIIKELLAEVALARAARPEEDNYPSGNGPQARVTWMRMAQNTVERAVREGRCTLTELLDENAHEVMAEGDPTVLRRKLIELMALSYRWIEKLDRDVQG